MFCQHEVEGSVEAIQVQEGDPGTPVVPQFTKDGLALGGWGVTLVLRVSFPILFILLLQLPVQGAVNSQ